MATASRPPDDEREVLKAAPRRDADRKALRATINARFANTLRYLGR